MDTCKESGCDRPVKVKLRMLCDTHYQRWQRANKPNSQGKRCSADDCERVYYANGLCRMHDARMRQFGTLALFRERTPQTPRYCHCGKEAGTSGLCPNHYSQKWLDEHAGTYDKAHWSKPAPSYQAAHLRLVLVRGRARDYGCELCPAQGEQWALKADAENLRFDALPGRKTLTAFSDDADDYFATCRDCHSAYDAEHRNRNYKLQKARWEESA